MPRFLLSVFLPAEPGPFGPYASQAEMDEALDATAAFNAELEREGHLVFVDGLDEPATATVVDARSGEAVRTPGPAVASARPLGGLWVVEAADQDAAVALAERASRACRNEIEVRPFRVL